jgi:hypothetical protein
MRVGMTGLYRLSGRLPILMSLLALAICIMAWAGILADPPGDEGWQAHVYQLLMVGELPVIAFYLLLAVGVGLRRSLPTLGLQVLLWLAAVGAIPLFGL